MRVIRRDIDYGYLDRWLWVPKRFIDVHSVKSALTYETPASYAGTQTRIIYLWKETQHHLLIPRAFWDPLRIPCTVIDCRPVTYNTIEFRSHIKLDHRVKEIGSKKMLVPTGDDVQRRSIAALESNPGGILQLACGKGKAQPVDTSVLTPDGWKHIGSLTPGDLVIGSDGAPTKITGVYPQGRLPVYKVLMDDGASTRCCDDHLWYTHNAEDHRLGVPGQVRTLKQVRTTLDEQHSIQRVGSVQYASSNPVYAPWLIGAYLGCGTARTYRSVKRIQFDSGDANLLELIAADVRWSSVGKDEAQLLPIDGKNKNRTVKVIFNSTEPSPLWSALSENDLVGVTPPGRFIPKKYLYAGIKDRWSLLNGLLESDGTVTQYGRSFSTTSRRLALDVAHLARSLECRVSIESRKQCYEYKGKRREGATSLRLHIIHPRWGCNSYTRQYIRKVERCTEEECVCIQVEAQDQQYVTEDLIVTHNTVVALEHIARSRVPALVMLDNTQLLYQWQTEAEKLLFVPGGVGVFGDGKKDWKKGLVLATYHSVANWSDTIPEEARRWFGQIFWDEGHHCFIPGTLVDGNPIESVRIGTLVRSYNHRTSTVELKPVTHVHVSRATSLLRIQCYGKEYVCTPEHPFYTRRGYVQAKDLNQHDELMHTTQEDILLDFCRVDSVEVLQPGSNGTFGGMCPEGIVYNLEVADNSNYFVDDTLVHNCPAPVFCKTADMFYGKRYSLTATPERLDGLHVLSDGHIGPVLYKDLTPTMTPVFGFIWTGVSASLDDPTAHSRITDVKGNVNVPKIYAFLSRAQERLNLILNAVRTAKNVGRMTLVLSNSIDEVLNLANAWERPGHPSYTDIPMPTPADVGEQLSPLYLKAKDVGKLARRKKSITDRLRNSNRNDETVLRAELANIAQIEKQIQIGSKLYNELRKRKQAYLEQLLKDIKEVGILTYGVDPHDRQRSLNEKQVVFAITKYGKEGLDCPRLDTVILSSLFSSKNSLQQLIGRPTRVMANKKTPLLLFLVDDIGLCSGMAKKLVGHLRVWPADEGGPYEPVFCGFPKTWRTRKTSDVTAMLNQ